MIYFPQINTAVNICDQHYTSYCHCGTF